jgi:NADPH:quinone reductase-like Zn-dependent oxidoreductase
MKTLLIRNFGGPDRLTIAEIPIPEPRSGQLRVKVAASAVNPIDLSTRSGALAQAGLLVPAPEVALGWDFAGVVDATGTRVARFRRGDSVIGLRDVLSTIPGAQAEYVVVDESAVAPAPKTATLVEAATLPLNGLTADRSLDLAGVGPGDTLLVTGAAGAVGGYVLELAKLRGVHTVAVASADDEPLVRQIGAADFVPRAEKLAQPVRDLVPGGVDAVIDAAVVGITAHETLRGGGRFVALVRPFAPPPIRGTEVVVQEVFADGVRLAELSALVDAGHLTLRVADTVPLADAATAHERLSQDRPRGRLVLIP